MVSPGADGALCLLLSLLPLCAPLGASCACARGLTLLLMLVAWQVGFGYYWLRYPLCFSVGVAYAIYERSIYKQIKSYRILCLPVVLLLMGVYIWSVQTFPNQPIVLMLASHLAYFALPVMLTTLSKAWGATDLFMRRAHGPMGLL